jgi:transposase InsO family protein
MGHVNDTVVKKAAEMVEGIEITDGTANQGPCETCKLSSAPRQISRRPIGQDFGRFGKIYFDLIDMKTSAYNGHRWVTHFYIEGIRFHWMYTHARKDECRLAVEQFISFIKNWWGIPIKAFHYDNEVAAGRMVEEWLALQGIIVFHSVAGQPEQNGPAERSGGVIIQMARKLCVEGRLPDDLWPEITKAAVWLLNRLPTFKDGQWIVPWDEARRNFGHDRMKPSNLSNLRLFGSLAYCRIKSIPRREKLKPRAEIGFLVGYLASNVWKIWFPSRGKVEHVRDAVFDESRRYKPRMQLWEEISLPQPEPQILSDYEALDVSREALGMPGNAMRFFQREDQGEHRSYDDAAQKRRFSGGAVAQGWGCSDETALGELEGLGAGKSEAPISAAGTVSGGE